MVFSKEHKEKSGIGGMRLQVFSSEEMDAIHYASLHLLGKVGIKVGNEEAAQIFGDNGCSVRDWTCAPIQRFAATYLEKPPCCTAWKLCLHTPANPLASLYWVGLKS